MDKTENIGLFCDKCRHTPCICGLEKTIKDVSSRIKISLDELDELDGKRIEL